MVGLRIQSRLLSDFADLPAHERTAYEGGAQLEHRLGKRLRCSAIAKARNRTALWGLSSDNHPVDPKIIQERLQQQHPDGIPGFTSLAPALREHTCAAAFIRDKQLIPKAARLWTRSHCMRLHPGLCISRDRGIADKVKHFAKQAHSHVKEALPSTTRTWWARTI